MPNKTLRKDGRREGKKRKKKTNGYRIDILRRIFRATAYTYTYTETFPRVAESCRLYISYYRLSRNYPLHCKPLAHSRVGYLSSIRILCPISPTMYSERYTNSLCIYSKSILNILTYTIYLIIYQINKVLYIHLGCVFCY